MSLKFIAISGTTDVTENLYVYEYDNDLIVVDCGVGFPEPEMYGVDLVIPDFSYLKENQNKIRGVLISHGHEDHMGALPFLFREIKAPIYSTKLVAGFIEDKFADYEMPIPKVNVFNPERDVLSLGAFKVTPFRVSHSVPDGVGFGIDTPEGIIFHVPDYKFDWTPVDGRPFDIVKLSGLANGGALGLVSDCLGSTSLGYTESEKAIEGRIQTLVEKASGQVFFTTISSNISRMQQAINVAERLGRKVAFVGRSIDKKAQISKELGYLSYQDGVVVPLRQAIKLPINKVMYIISGSYGQPGSALYRTILGEHDLLKIKEADTVIFSSDPAPPGSKGNVDFLVDKLIEVGADVHYYDIQEDLHVSGHGSQEDIKMLMAITRPKFFIPIGGTVRYMRAYKNIAVGMGASDKSVFELSPGQIVSFKDGNGRVDGRIKVKSVLVDGLGIGDVGNVVLRDRHILAKDGIAIVMLQFDKNEGRLVEDPEVISRGFVYEEKEKGFLKEAGRRLRAKIEQRGRADFHLLRDTTVDFMERHFFEKTGRRPMILPVVVEI